MKSILAVGIVLFLAGCSTTHDHDHHQHHHASSEKALESVKSSERFSADKDLKVRMEKILNAMKNLNTNGNMTKPKQVKSTGQEVQQTVKDIFKTCKLEPAADAAIHPILAEILNGADLFQKGDGKGGNEKIHQALLKYEELFIHEGWAH